MNKTAAIYARVSSEQQKEQNTIASQTAALRDYARAQQYTLPAEWVFEDEGYSGSVLTRPGLERLRDLIAEGAIETVLVYGPDRLSRNYAYQVILLEEFARHGTEVVFLNAPAADTPEQRRLLQFQGMNGHRLPSAVGVASGIRPKPGSSRCFGQLLTAIAM
jgi:site-specific DNA recombinase